MTNHYFLYNSQVTQENASLMTLSVTEVRIHDKYRGRQLLTLPLTLCIALQNPGWVLSENRSLLGFGPLAVLFTILCYSISCSICVFFLVGAKLSQYSKSQPCLFYPIPDQPLSKYSMLFCA